METTPARRPRLRYFVACAAYEAADEKLRATTTPAPHPTAPMADLDAWLAQYDAAWEAVNMTAAAMYKAKTEDILLRWYAGVATDPDDIKDLAGSLPMTVRSALITKALLWTPEHAPNHDAC